MTLQWRRQPRRDARHALVAGPWMVAFDYGGYGLWRDGVLVKIFDCRTDALNEAERRHAAESVRLLKCGTARGMTCGGRYWRHRF